MDYAHSRRVKLWGKLRVVEGDAKLLEQLRDDTIPAKLSVCVVIRD